MLVSLDGIPQPAICEAAHWAMFTTLRQHGDLYDPLRTRIVQAVSDIVNADPDGAAIESAHLGAQILGDVGSWWHGEFARRFPHFLNGADRGLFGMVLWNYLAQRPDWWCFVEQQDRHGYGENSMRYWLLQPGDPLIPKQGAGA